MSANSTYNSPPALFRFNPGAEVQPVMLVGTNGAPTGSPSGFVNITTATTTIVKATPGSLITLVVNTPVASGTITMYNNTAGSGAKVGTITFPATLVSDGPIEVKYNVACSTGITIVTTGIMDITVVYS